MKKSITVMVAMMFLMTLLAVPMVSASTVEGTGQSRTVTLYTPAVDTNVTVVVPTIIQNDTANSFVFTVIDESGGTDDYLLNVSININGTYYNESASVSSVADDNVTAYVNYTADTLPINASANITIELVFDTNYTQADVWYGEIETVDATRYSMRVTLMNTMIELIGVAILIMFIMVIFNYLKGAVEPSKGKKK